MGLRVCPQGVTAREGIFRGVRLALVVRTDASSTNTRRARWIFAFLSGSVRFLHPRLVHVRVIESMAHLRWQWVNDLDGLERDFADPVAGLQKTEAMASGDKSSAAVFRAHGAGTRGPSASATGGL